MKNHLNIREHNIKTKSIRNCLIVKHHDRVALVVLCAGDAVRRRKRFLLSVLVKSPPTGQKEHTCSQTWSSKSMDHQIHILQPTQPLQSKQYRISTYLPPAQSWGASGTRTQTSTSSTKPAQLSRSEHAWAHWRIVPPVTRLSA